MKYVADVLATKPHAFNFIEPDAKVIDALNLFTVTNLSYLVVMHHDTFHGIFSERDYSRNVALKGKTSATCLVREAMSSNLPFVTPADTVEKCIRMILDFQTRYLPVLEDGAFKGVITIHDILRIALRSKGQIFDEQMTAELLETDEKIY